MAATSEFFSQVIATGIAKAALIDDRPAFEAGARQYSLDDWKLLQIGKVAGVGGLTGLAGGPAGLALEAADLAFLFSTMGRACFGVGAVVNRRPVDYDADIPLILALWAGAATPVHQATAQNISAKLGTKAAVYIGGTRGAELLAKVGVKAVSKASFKGGSKLAAKAIGKAAGKLAAKLAAKTGTKWIPIVGGLVSAGINSWVVNGVLMAAEEFYRADYLAIEQDLAA